MRAAFFLAATAVVFGCTSAPYEHLPVRAPVAAPTAFVAPPGLSRLRLGLVPYVSEATLRGTHEKLAAWLSKELGVEIEVVVGKNYDDVGEMLSRGELDFAELSPYVYVRTKEKVKLRPLVMAIADGSDTSAGYIVVKRDSPLRRIEDLKGQSFGYVDPASATGYLLPRVLLREHHLDPDHDFSSTQVLGNHEAVLLAVYDGRVAAGGTFQGGLTALKRSKGINPLTFRVIAKTSRSPRDLYAARADLDPRVGDALFRLFLSISSRNEPGRDLLSPMDINGYVPADDEAYADVERAHRVEQQR